MTAMGSIAPRREGVGTLVHEELAELVMEATKFFETDRHKAKCCLQRAAQLVSDKKEGGSDGEAAVAERGGLAPWQVRRLTSHIDVNMGSRILAEELAVLVHVSLGHFFRAFRGSFRMSPHAYIMRQRILRAEVLMVSSEKSLSRIAIECGLADQAHFSRTFRRIVGVSPALWRRSAVARPDLESPLVRGDSQI